MRIRQGHRHRQFSSRHPFKDQIWQSCAASWCQAPTSPKILGAVILKNTVASRHLLLVIPNWGCPARAQAGNNPCGTPII